MAMVIGRVHKVLLENKVRHLTSIVAITNEVVSPHDIAGMVAYGATAVYPYLLLKQLVRFVMRKVTIEMMLYFKFTLALN